MDITEFRKQYPQYDGISDQDLADKLYDKYYTGRIDRSEFDKQFLGSSDNWAMSTAKSLTRKAIGAIKGDATMDMGNLTDAGITGKSVGDKAAIASASMLGSDADVENQIRKRYPDAQILEDDNGNKYAQLPDGRRGYINRPGLDLEDVTRFAGKTLAFVPAAGAGALIKGGALAKSALVGGASAGTDVVMQKAADTEEYDPMQTIFAGAFGAGGEAIAPVIGKAMQSISTKVKSSEWFGMNDRQRINMVRQSLQDSGMDPRDMSNLTSEQWLAIADQQIRSGGMVTPEAAVANTEFGYQLTRGQQMPERTVGERGAKFSQMSEEERLRSTESGQRFRDVQDANVAQTDANLQRFMDELAGPGSESAMEGAQRVQSGLLDAERVARGEVDEAYRVARGFDAEIADEAILSIPDRVSDALARTGTTLDDSLTPGAARMLRDLESKPVTSIKDLDIQRQRLNNMFSDTMDRRDRRALRIIKDEFDQAISDAIDADLFSGDPEALDALKEARSLFADYAKKFRSNDEAGRVVQKIMDIDATPEQIANLMIGVNGLSKAGSANIAKRYGEIVGRDSEAFNALRETVFLTITRKPTDETKGGQALVSTLKKALKGQGSSLMKEIYTPEELSTLRRFTTALEVTLPKGDMARSSGTAERLMRFYNASNSSMLLLGFIRSAMESHGVSRALMPPVAPINRSAITASTVAPANAANAASE